MNDGRIDIDARLNSKEAEKGLKALSGKLTSFGQSMQSKFKNISMPFTELSSALGLVKGAVSAVSAVISDLSKSYIEQTKAEKQLEIAARNNPYLNDSNVAALRNYASEIQSLTVYSEGELLPMMAQLSASGRTQQQIMDIMGAAVDVAASGTMDLSSAVSSLNATYNGTAGTLGRQNGAIKNLTEEQLKNGDAVKIISEQYKGMASEIAKSTGAGERLKNAFDDLKSTIGKPFVEAMTPMANFFTDLINGWVDAKKKKDEYYDAKKAEKKGETTVSQDEALLSQAKKRQEELRKSADDFDKKWRRANEQLEAAKKQHGALHPVTKNLQAETDLYATEVQRVGALWQEAGKRVDELTERVKKKADAEKAESEKKQAQAEAEKAADDAAAREKARKETAEAALKTYRETIAAKEQELKLRKELGENITQEKENTEMLQTRQAAYIKLIQDAQGTITGGAERERIEREKILKLVEATTDAQKEAEAEEAKKALLKDLDDALNDSKKKKQSEIMAKQISELEIEYAKLTADKKLEIEKEYTEKLEELRKQQQKMVQEERTKEEQDYYKSIEKKIEIVSSFADKYTNIMTTISNMITKQAQNEATVKQAVLEKQYNDGLVSQTEYQKRKDEIEKEAAEKSYRIQMWQWAASIAQATANTAQAMVSTLAQETGPAALKIAMAAMVAAAGGAQLATIIANKPIPPSRFATGGIVGGTSYTGDRVTAHVNSGEMILNRMQQRNLFDSINSNQLGTKPQMNVKIFNSASNEVSARPEITEDGIRIMIRKIVSEDIGSGRMNKNLIAAQSSFGGTRYTN